MKLKASIDTQCGLSHASRVICSALSGSGVPSPTNDTHPVKISTFLSGACEGVVWLEQDRDALRLMVQTDAKGADSVGIVAETSLLMYASDQDGQLTRDTYAYITNKLSACPNFLAALDGEAIDADLIEVIIEQEIFDEIALMVAVAHWHKNYGLILADGVTPIMLAVADAMKADVSETLSAWDTSFDAIFEVHAMRQLKSAPMMIA